MMKRCGETVCERQYLETVDLNHILLSDLLLDEELGTVLPLVTLQLDHLAVLLVFDDGSVAAEVLLQHLENLLLVVLFAEAL